MANVLIVCAGIVGGAAAGMLPAIIARKTFLAPQPDAGLGDLGAGLLALIAGALGAVVGAIVGLVVTTRRLKRAATSTVRFSGVLVFLLVACPSAVVVLAIAPTIGVPVAVAVFLVAGAQIFAASPFQSKRSVRRIRDRA
jgi:hypothetical protein